MSDSEELIERLALAQRGHREEEVGLLVGQIAEGFRPELVAPLLSTLGDEEDMDATIFGIVHLAESADDADYVAGLLRVLPVLRETSSRWARILLGRVLNDPVAFSELLDTAARVSEEERAALRDVGQSLLEWRPQQFRQGVSHLFRALP